MAALLEATRPALKDVLGKVYSMSRDQVRAERYLRLQARHHSVLAWAGMTPLLMEAAPSSKATQCSRSINARS